MDNFVSMLGGSRPLLDLAFATGRGYRPALRCPAGRRIACMGDSVMAQGSRGRLALLGTGLLFCLGCMNDDPKPLGKLPAKPLPSTLGTNPIGKAPTTYGGGVQPAGFANAGRPDPKTDYFKTAGAAVPTAPGVKGTGAPFPPPLTPAGGFAPAPTQPPSGFDLQPPVAPGGPVGSFPAAPVPPEGSFAPMSR